MQDTTSFNEFALRTHSCLHQPYVLQRHSNFRVLNNAELTLPSEERDLLGFSHIRHIRPNKCFTEEYKKFPAERSIPKLVLNTSASTPTRVLLSLASSTTVSTLGPSGLASATLVASGADSNDSSCV